MRRYLARISPAPAVLLLGATTDASAVDPLSSGRSARNGQCAGNWPPLMDDPTVPPLPGYSAITLG
jgi:predicted lipoprotein with Yx(FWY)xxD motif